MTALMIILFIAFAMLNRFAEIPSESPTTPPSGDPIDTRNWDSLVIPVAHGEPVGESQVLHALGKPSSILESELPVWNYRTVYGVGRIIFSAHRIVTHIFPPPLPAPADSFDQAHAAITPAAVTPDCTRMENWKVLAMHGGNVSRVRELLGLPDVVYEVFLVIPRMRASVFEYQVGEQVGRVVMDCNYFVRSLDLPTFKQ